MPVFPTIPTWVESESAALCFGRLFAPSARRLLFGDLAGLALLTQRGALGGLFLLENHWRSGGHFGRGKFVIVVGLQNSNDVG